MLRLPSSSSIISRLLSSIIISAASFLHLQLFKYVLLVFFTFVKINVVSVFAFVHESTHLAKYSFFYIFATILYYHLHSTIIFTLPFIRLFFPSYLTYGVLLRASQIDLAVLICVGDVSSMGRHQRLWASYALPQSANELHLSQASLSKTLCATSCCLVLSLLCSRELPFCSVQDRTDCSRTDTQQRPTTDS